MLYVAISSTGVVTNDRVSFQCMYCYACTDHCPIIICSVKHSGNLTMEDIMKIARTMRNRSMAKCLAGTVKEVLGE